ncbi:unnamed protein product [Cylindrotheca closterium]|uniref:Uncharacterized protein n=1 Tax=Cylindrotheca closterium TaxID=2856 RepID=A0AAD2CWQ0_9STRA|nr:unnamed protein product [Cylindrotheca closterium]
MLRSTRCISQLEQRMRRLPIHPKSFQCHFSSVDAAKKEDDSGEDKKEFKKQPFVTAKLEPGEWDLQRTNPYFRPKPPRSRMISAEDFANRPPVGFENEFGSYEDSMVSLSWLDQKTSRKIYQIYVDMMVLSQQQHKTTSHEYVCRVIAQKFNITPTRAAAVIQLQHAEEQMRQHNPDMLCDDQAKYAEEAIQQNIRDAYKAQRAQIPKQPFVEDPVGAHGRGEPDETSVSWTSTDDIYDLEDKITQANVRDAEQARLIIDGHLYKEDVDDVQVQVKTDSTTKRLLKDKKKIADELEEASGSIPYPETNAKGEKRDRWKFVAKVVNTRAMRKKGRRVTKYTNNNVENTLVEHDGELRVATVAEAKQVAWKPTRTKGNEYIFEGAKKAWLEKTLEGKTGVWGRAPPTMASQSTKKAAEEKKEEEKVVEAASKEEASIDSKEEKKEDEKVEASDKDSSDSSDSGSDSASSSDSSDSSDSDSSDSDSDLEESKEKEEASPDDAVEEPGKEKKEEK